MKIVPEQIARFVPRDRPFNILGTDGMGRSDTREALRRHFEIDAGHVVVATLTGLVRGRPRRRRRRWPTRSPIRHRPRGARPHSTRDRLGACPARSTSPVTRRPTSCSTPTAPRSSSACCSTSRCRWSGRSPVRRRCYARLGHLDAPRIAAMDVDEFVAVCCAKPAIHRFPAAMGRRIHEVCTVARRASTTGAAENVWRDVADGADALPPAARAARLRRREVEDLHRHARQAQGVRPAGWQEAAGKFGDDGAALGRRHRRTRVRWRRCASGSKAQKAAKRDKQDRPVG